MTVYTTKEKMDEMMQDLIDKKIEEIEKELSVKIKIEYWDYMVKE